MSTSIAITLGSGVIYVHSESAPWAKEAFSESSSGGKATFLRSLDQGGGGVLLDVNGLVLTGASRVEALNTLRSELYVLEGRIRSTCEMFNRARDATFDLLRERYAIAFPSASCPYNSPVEMARALALNMAELWKHHAKLASRRSKLEKREESRAIGGATSIDGQENLEVQELEEERRQVQELADKLERHRNLHAAERLQRLAGTSRVRQVLVVLLEYSDYTIAQPRHLVSHPRPAFTNLTAFLDTLPVPLPPPNELSALVDALSVRIVGPLHRRQIAFLDENNSTHVEIEQALAKERAGETASLAPSSLAPASSMCSSSSKAATAPIAQDSFVVSRSSSHPIPPLHSSPTRAHRTASPAASPPAPTRPPRPAPIAPPRDWAEFFALLYLSEAIPASIVVVLNQKTLFLPATYLNTKDKRRRKNLIEVGNVPEHIADMIGDAMEDLVPGSETFWALQSVKARAERRRD